MSKFRLFVGVYSVVMILLFLTFCFLMTTINPSRIKQEPEPLRKYGSEDFIYSNDFLPNDNVAYGLEKVDDDYDSIDVITKRIIENRRSLPPIYKEKSLKTNFTRTETQKVVTESMKHIKGLRRSINKESQQDDKISRSVHLRIKDLDGRPRIEIKVVPEKSKSRKMRKYRSSSNITNNTLKFHIDNDITKYVYDNISKEVIVIIENNEKLVLDFAKASFNLYDDNKIDNNKNYINNDNKDELLNDKNISESNAIHNQDLLHTNNIEGNVTKMNKTESNQTNIEESTQSVNKSSKTEIKSLEISINSVTLIDTRNKVEFETNSTKDSNGTAKTYEPSDDRQTDKIKALVSIPVNTLVGLLIPEATATLPFNYHFIN